MPGWGRTFLAHRKLPKGQDQVKVLACHLLGNPGHVTHPLWPLPKSGPLQD